MSITAVRAYLAQFGLDSKVLEFPVSSATVELAAEAAGVIPARIAKSLSFKVDGKADRKSTRLNSSHVCQSRMPSSA